ncbi:CoxG family protein [Simplicispira suum]|uniref:Carbon monoxide dehydrogenase n=1 Tax=Simplicispira suum TaxID=2109915 RepID=A0A2S0MWZ2_9BURK|nr:carbon monoxide dehydrogenase subunit G [Simplicispira suum]AVO40221.1 carbon monoxide dehydrogenase [Simplicispira suum]MBW7834010.1 carbon monoxide dehydrogenase subunit G [Simplicispira suum]
MDMEARRAFAASPQEVWDALNDPDVLKACIPGCDRFEAVDTDHYALNLALKMGAGSPRFQANVQLADRFPPERYQVHFEGDGGVAGTGKGVGRARLIPLADYAPGHPRCQLHYSVDVSLDGNITKIDPRLVDGAAQGLAEHFFRRLDEQLRRRYPRAAPTELRAAPQDMDADERAGAPTMLLDRASRAPAPQRQKPVARAPLFPRLGWIALAGAALLLVAYFFARSR